MKVLRTKERIKSREPRKSQMPHGPTCDFPETSYGIVKRVEVFSGWIEDFKRREGRQTVSILDFGCGTGLTLTRPLGRTGDAILGVDMHAASVEVAHRQNLFKNVRYRVADISDLLDRQERFDVIICSEVLEHLKEPETHLRDFHRLLKTPGILIVSVPNGSGPFERLRRVEELLDRFGIHQALLGLGRRVRSLVRRTWRWFGGTIPNPIMGSLNDESPHVSFFWLPDLEAMCQRTGFEVTDFRGRTFLCGRYIDFWLDRRPFRVLLPLNNALGDWLPLRFCSDWMLLLRKISNEC
jgi:2-polyprenyl-3-methyl-5-hydroxy-6-metoxy-1,4-benzoquinol methylase